MGYCPPPLRPLPEDLPPRRPHPPENIHLRYGRCHIPPIKNADEDWPPHLCDNPQPFGCLWVVAGFAAVVVFMALLSSRIMQEPIPVPEKPVLRAEAEVQP